jgi:hypothetical protein
LHSTLAANIPLQQLAPTASIQQTTVKHSASNSKTSSKQQQSIQQTPAKHPTSANSS